VWVVRHPEPRPWLVNLHGAAMGQARVDLRTFKAAWLHHGLGLNLAFVVLPRHGPRREGLPIGVGFPDDDLLDNVHAVAQTMWDTRRLLAWIRSETDQPVGLHGLSLGGYAAALLAGLDPDLACVIAGVPPVDFADLFERHAPRQFRHSPEWARLVPLSRAAHRVVSPLEITPVVPVDRRFIYAGLADRLVHPKGQVERLWRHWEEPEIEWFRGGHVGFFFANQVQTFLTDALRSSGLLTSPHAGADVAPER
jgi:dienelactone hydrolase